MSQLAELTVQLELQSAAFQRGMEQATRSMQRVEQYGKRVDQSLKGLSQAFVDVAKSAAAAVAAFASFESVKSIITTADKMKNLEASLTALTGSAEVASTSMSLIKQTAQEVGLPIFTVAEATQKLTIGLNDLGGKEGDIDKIVKSFAMLGRIGGTSLEDVKGALLQYSQAISSGRLGGDELRSIMERMPLVGKTIADALGVPVGKLKEMGAEGELTSDKVAKAMIDAAEKIEGKFKTLPATFEQSVSRMQNKASELYKALDKALNVSSVASSAFESIGGAIQNMTRFVSDFSAAWRSASPENRIAATSVAVGALAALFTGPLVTAIGAVGAAMLANPMLAAVGAISAAVLLLATNWDKVKIELSDGIPAAIAILEKAFYQAMRGIVQSAAKAAETVYSLWASYINAIVEGLNKIGEILPEKLGGGFKIQKLSSDIKFFGDTISGFDQKIIDADVRSSEALQRRSDAYSKLKEAQDKIVGESGKINPPAGAGGKGGSGVEDFAEQLQKLIDKLDPASKSAREAREAIDLLNEAMAQGMLTPERYAELLKKVGDNLGKDDGIKGKLDEILDQMNSFTKQFVDGIVDAMFEGKLNMERLLKDMAKSITKWLLNSQIQQFFKAMKGFDIFGLGGGSSGIGPGTSGFWAKGGAFANGIEFFANGGIVGAPMAFGMAGGRIGVMGEAGPEAIVPLKRSASGDLGVKSSPVIVNVINQAGVKVETTEKEQPNGVKEITMLIRREVATGINDGSFDKQFRTAFGMTRQGY